MDLTKKIILLLCAWSIFVLAQDEPSAPASSSDKILAGYYPDWGVWNTPSYTVDKIPYDKFTHVIWSFISPNADGSLRGDAVGDPSALDQMVTMAHEAGVKAIISLGGAGLCENFASVAASDELRKKFVDELSAFVSGHNLDGVDMDWEFSKVPVAAEDTIAYNKLLHDIRVSLPEGKTLSAALPCSDYYGKFFTAEALVENLDWFGFMTYDITGDWDDKARFDSPLLANSKWTTWSWKQTAAYWKKRGVPTEKMVFGIPNFGFVFYGTTGPGFAFDQGSTKNMSYAEIMEMEDWQFFYDDVSKEPYGIAGDRFVTYENEQSVSDKAVWILENNYAGAMVWELSNDYIEGKGQPVMEALSSALLGGVVQGISPKRNSRRMILPRGAGAYTYDALGHIQKGKKAAGHYYQVVRPLPFY